MDFQHPFAGRIAESEEIRRQTDHENIARVRAMSSEEREMEKEELLDRFGPGLVELMRKRKEKREQRAVHETDLDQPAPAAGPSRLQGRDEVAQIREEVMDENRHRVEAMTEGERLEEVKELVERFGAATINALRARAEARQPRRTQAADLGPSSEQLGRSSADNQENNPDKNKPNRCLWMPTTKRPRLSSRNISPTTPLSPRSWLGCG
jgi:hypothetical protein